MYLSLGHSGYVSSVTLSADGSKVVSGSRDKTVKIWSTETGQVLQTLSGEHGLINYSCTACILVCLYVFYRCNALYDYIIA